MKRYTQFSKERGGLILVFVYSISAVLLVLFIALSSKIFFNKLFSSRNIERMQALHIAEAGLDYALSNLRDNYSWSPSASSIPFENGEFLVSLTAVASRKLVQSTGFIPDQANYKEKKILEAWMKESIPGNFYSNAIYSSGEVDLNGVVHTINGKVVYYSELDNSSRITGTVTQDDTANPLAMLDFEDLYNKSALQDNVYDQQRLDNGDAFPTEFWNSPPSIPGDPTTGMPNFVYIEGDLILNGTIDIGGFFIVVGDVLNYPSAVYNSDINGNGTIDGCIYTRGEFRINGGAGGLNVDGGVWSGTKTRINGNATINYRSDYMAAIEDKVDPDAQLLSWRELVP